MSGPVDVLAPGALPPVPVTCPADEFDNFVRKWGIGHCCEWFGCSDDTEFYVRILRERNDAALARVGGAA